MLRTHPTVEPLMSVRPMANIDGDAPLAGIEPSEDEVDRVRAVAHRLRALLEELEQRDSDAVAQATKIEVIQSSTSLAAITWCHFDRGEETPLPSRVSLTEEARMAQETVISIGSAEANRKEEIKQTAIRLRAMLLARPCAKKWPVVLQECGLRWVGVPLRATPRRLNRHFARWVDRVESAGDSSLFSASGIWTSPYTPWVAGAASLAFVAVALLNVPVKPFNFATQNDVTSSWPFMAHCTAWALLLAAMALALNAGQRPAAKSFLLVGSTVSIGWDVLQAIAEACSMECGNFALLFGVDAERGPLQGRALKIAVRLYNGVFIVLVALALVLLPKRSFWILFGGFSAGFLIQSALFFIIGDEKGAWAYFSIPWVLGILGACMYYRRQRARRLAEDRLEVDCQRYRNAWRRARESHVASDAALAELTCRPPQCLCRARGRVAAAALGQAT